MLLPTTLQEARGNEVHPHKTLTGTAGWQLMLTDACFSKSHMDPDSHSPLAPGTLPLGRGLFHICSEGTGTVVFAVPPPSLEPDTQKVLHPYLWKKEQTLTSTVTPLPVRTQGRKGSQDLQGGGGSMPCASHARCGCMIWAAGVRWGLVQRSEGMLQERGAGGGGLGGA